MVTDSVEHIKLAYEKLDGDSYNTVQMYRYRHARIHTHTHTHTNDQFNATRFKQQTQF